MHYLSWNILFSNFDCRGLTLRSGQLHCQSYWRDLEHRMALGELDLSWMYTHRIPLQDLPKAYKLFDAKEEGIVKVLVECE
jgi:threonine dehydrogenase-like Zn-dependent dehydrogenase